jgi:hypothetical protein
MIVLAALAVLCGTRYVRSLPPQPRVEPQPPLGPMTPTFHA